MGYGWGWGFWIFGPIFLVLIAVAIYYALTYSHRERYSHHSHNRQPQYHGGRAVEILKERYAKGEITKEQFYQMRERLNFNPKPTQLSARNAKSYVEMGAVAKGLI